MANLFSGLTAYVEEKRYGLDFYTQAVQRNDLFPFITNVNGFFPGVKEDTIKLPNLSAVAGISSGSACVTDFNLGNDTTITQSSISLTKGFVGDEICPHDGFETYYTAMGMTAGQNYEGLGAFEAGIFAEIQRKVGKRIVTNAWTGNASPDTWSFTGWQELLLAANMGSAIVGSSTPTSGGSAGTDAAGVYNICEALINSAMADVDFASEVESGNVYIVMSPKEKEFLRQNYLKLFGQALPTPGLADLQGNVFGAFNFPGTNVPVYTQSALTGTGTIILSRNGNQVLAMDLLSDTTDLRVGMDQYMEKLWWKFRFKMGVGWRDLTSGSIRYWGPTT